MNKLWINNTLEDRLAMLQRTEETHLGVNQSAIEKDWWVTIVLHALFQCSCSPALTFKGGTSLSKGFNLIERFSEDIDLAIHRSFFGIDKTNKSQREKLRKLSRSFISEDLSEQLDKQLQSMGISGYEIENVTSHQSQLGEQTTIDSDQDPTVIFLHYKSIVGNTIDYIPSRVKIEISCLSMDEPTQECSIQSMISERFPEEDMLRSTVRTVLPTRTFLEKIFLLAEEFQKEHPRHIRMSRHLYDLERIMDTEYGEEALANRQLYDAIVEHRRTFYALKYVDYDKHAPSVISFVPRNEFIPAWNKDYDNMQAHFLYGVTLSFNELLQRMVDLQDRIRKIAQAQ